MSLKSSKNSQRTSSSTDPGGQGQAIQDADGVRSATLAERWSFLGSFLRKPGQIGAVTPSSPHLAHAMMANLDLEHARAVVELGPGTGPFTEMILHRIGNQTAFVAMELDATCVARLRQRFPGLNVYQDSAEKMGEYLARHGLRKADYIISGLPWATLPTPVQKAIFEAILATLVPGGAFTTFAYVHACWMPRARQFRRRLEAHFDRVELSPVVWRNFPPAFVYRCFFAGASAVQM